jgi:hypothetical protein
MTNAQRARRTTPNPAENERKQFCASGFSPAGALRICNAPDVPLVRFAIKVVIYPV